jgi:hypothetical protein
MTVSRKTPAKQLKAWRTEAKMRGEAMARAQASWTTTDPVKAKIALRTLARKSATESERAAALPARPTLEGNFYPASPEILAVNVAGEGAAPELVEDLAKAWTEGVEAAFLDACKQRLKAVIA